jgi:hypothetical protein
MYITSLATASWIGLVLLKACSRKALAVAWIGASPRCRASSFVRKRSLKLIGLFLESGMQLSAMVKVLTPLPLPDRALLTSMNGLLVRLGGFAWSWASMTS